MSKTSIIQQVYQAFGTGDMPTFFSKLSEDVTWHSHYTDKIPFNGIYNKAEGIQKLLQTLGSSIDTKVFEPLSFLENETNVVVLGKEEAVAKSTGNTYVNHWVHVFDFTGEKVSAINTYNSTDVVEKAF